MDGITYATVSGLWVQRGTLKQTGDQFQEKESSIDHQQEEDPVGLGETHRRLSLRRARWRKPPRKKNDKGMSGFFNIRYHGQPKPATRVYIQQKR